MDYSKIYFNMQIFLDLEKKLVNEANQNEKNKKDKYLIKTKPVSFLKIL